MKITAEQVRAYRFRRLRMSAMNEDDYVRISTMFKAEADYYHKEYLLLKQVAERYMLFTFLLVMFNIIYFGIKLFK